MEEIVVRSFLASAVNWDEQRVPRPGLFTPPKEGRLPNDMTVGWEPELVCVILRRRKYLKVLGIE